MAGSGRGVVARVGLALLLAAGGVVLGQTRLLAASCETSAPANGAFSVTVCITSPAPSSTLTGDTTVTATATVTNGKTIKNVEFFLGTEYLLTDYESPYTFAFPASLFPDGLAYLKARATVTRGSYSDFFSTKASIPVTIAVDGPLPSSEPFQPREPVAAPGEPVEVVAAGDGANGGKKAGGVINRISALDPDMLLYLGDVYARGTGSEFLNWYGSQGSRWDAFRDITNPAVGNHEYETAGAAPFFSYWGQPPHYYSVDSGGWHIAVLDSTEGYAQVTAGTDQFEWLSADLAAADACTLVAMHHPVFSLGQGDGARLGELWDLLAAEGVDAVLSGHAHNYQRWEPLDADGEPDPLGTTPFVVGTGGHFLYPFTGSDDRVESSNAKKHGALRLLLTPGAATFSFVASGGGVLDQGALTCSPEIDHEPPTAPVLQASASAPDQIDLSWSASDDDVAVTGYTVWRDGQEVTTVAADVLGFADVGLSPETTYAYVVEALDGAGNATASNEATATTPQLPDTEPPTAPPDLIGGAQDAWTVWLDWGDSTDDRGVVGYDVYRNGALIAQLPSTETALLETGLEPGTTYTYVVIARDEAGNPSEPSSVIVVTPSEPTPEPSPTPTSEPTDPTPSPEEPTPSVDP